MAGPLAIGLMAAGTVVSSIGAIQSGIQQKKLYDFSASQSAQNALIAKQKASYDAARFKEKMARFYGRQAAVQGASGGTPSGSFLDVSFDTRYSANLDEEAIRYGGEIESTRWLGEAAVAEAKGEAALESSYWQAGTNLLTGSANTFATYNKVYPTTGKKVNS